MQKNDVKTLNMYVKLLKESNSNNNRHSRVDNKVKISLATITPQKILKKSCNYIDLKYKSMGKITVSHSPSSCKKILNLVSNPIIE